MYRPRKKGAKLNKKLYETTMIHSHSLTKYSDPTKQHRPPPTLSRSQWLCAFFFLFEREGTSDDLFFKLLCAITLAEDAGAASPFLDNAHSIPSAAISNPQRIEMQSFQSLPLSAGQRARLKAAGFERPDDLNVSEEELATSELPLGRRNTQTIRTIKPKPKQDEISGDTKHVLTVS